MPRYPLNDEEVRAAVHRAFAADDICGGRVPGFTVVARPSAKEFVEVGTRTALDGLEVSPMNAVVEESYDDLIEHAILPAVEKTGARMLEGIEPERAVITEWDLVEFIRHFGRPEAIVVAWKRKEARIIADMGLEPGWVFASHAVQWDQILWVRGGTRRFLFNRDPVVNRKGATTSVTFPVSVWHEPSVEPVRATLVTLTEPISLSMPGMGRPRAR